MYWLLIHLHIRLNLFTLPTVCNKNQFLSNLIHLHKITIYYFMTLRSGLLIFYYSNIIDYNNFVTYITIKYEL